MSIKQTRQTELRDDAWQRFERAVDVVAKSPPQHRSSKEKKHRLTKKVKIERKGMTKK
jgi:hypothetical protein